MSKRTTRIGAHFAATQRDREAEFNTFFGRKGEYAASLVGWLTGWVDRWMGGCDCARVSFVETKTKTEKRNKPRSVPARRGSRKPATSTTASTDSALELNTFLIEARSADRRFFLSKHLKAGDRAERNKTVSVYIECILTSSLDFPQTRNHAATIPACPSARPPNGKTVNSVDRSTVAQCLALPWIVILLLGKRAYRLAS